MLTRRNGAAAAVVAMCLTPLAGCSAIPGLAHDPGRQPTWAVQVTDIGTPHTAEVIDDRVLVVGETGVVALDRRNGKQRWSVTNKVAVRTAGDAVALIENDPGSDNVEIRDLRSGDLRFAVTDAEPHSDAPTLEEVALTTDALFVRRCSESIDCEIAALDLERGDEMWTRPTSYAETLHSGPYPHLLDGVGDQSELAAPPQAVVIASHREAGETEGRWRYAMLDVRTGEKTADFTVDCDKPSSVQVLGDLVYEAPDCGEPAVRDARSGKALWSPCSSLGTLSRDGDFLLSDQSAGAEVLDVTSGETVWRGPTGAELVGFDSGHVVTNVESDGDRDTIVATDLTTRRELWRSKELWTGLPSAFRHG